MNHDSHVNPHKSIYIAGHQSDTEDELQKYEIKKYKNN